MAPKTSMTPTKSASATPPSSSSKRAQTSSPKAGKDGRHSANKRTCCGKLCGCCMLLAKVVALFSVIGVGKWTVDKQLYPKGSCVGWEGSDSCEECKTSIGWMPFSLRAFSGLERLAAAGAARQIGERLLAPDLKATCSKCKQGWALVPGPPVKNQVFKNKNGTEFSWSTHCAEMLVEEERQVLMIRHGQSTWNAQLEKYTVALSALGMFIGEDAPLSKLGLKQAQRFANILRKADAEVYGSDPNASASELVAARSELDTNLEEEVEISEKKTKRVITDAEMVGNLASVSNRVELDVLVGRKCEDTNFVASPLTRAMDTLIIGTMERTSRCPTPWHISSNLQEIEHNSDCSAKLQPGDRPKFVNVQQSEYFGARIFETKKFVEAEYPKADSSRHRKTLKAHERIRLWDQSPQMVAELDATFASPKKYSVWGGHSIWFRVFFQYFADQHDEACKSLASMKVANTAVVSVKLRRLKNSPRKYVAYSCKFIHLGSDKLYKVAKKKSLKVKANESADESGDRKEI